MDDKFKDLMGKILEQPKILELAEKERDERAANGIEDLLGELQKRLGLGPTPEAMDNMISAVNNKAKETLIDLTEWSYKSGELPKTFHAGGAAMVMSVCLAVYIHACEMQEEKFGGKIFPNAKGSKAEERIMSSVQSHVKLALNMMRSAQKDRDEEEGE